MLRMIRKVARQLRAADHISLADILDRAITKIEAAECDADLASELRTKAVELDADAGMITIAHALRMAAKELETK